MNIVKELRKKKNVNQKDLASAIGVAQPTVSDWEAGKKDPSGDRLKKLADYFEVDELVILGRGISPEPEDMTDEEMIQQLIDKLNDRPSAGQARPLYSKQSPSKSTVRPDYETAALRATETLIRYQVSSAPVDPARIIKSIPGVLLLSYTQMAQFVGMDRQKVLNIFGENNQDAATIVQPGGKKVQYVVGYNQRLPFYLAQRALARELGHIILKHDGSRPEDVRLEEAQCFARYFLCPRPLIRAIEEEGIPITVELIGSITGCYKRCLEGMQITPGIRISPELNWLIRGQFEDYITNFLSYARFVKKDDHSELADFGTYMDNYEE